MRSSCKYCITYSKIFFFPYSLGGDSFTKNDDDDSENLSSESENSRSNSDEEDSDEEISDEDLEKFKSFVKTQVTRCIN